MNRPIGIYVVIELGQYEVTRAHITIEAKKFYGDDEITVELNMPEDETVLPQLVQGGDSVTITKHVDLVQLPGFLMERGNDPLAELAK